MSKHDIPLNQSIWIIAVCIASTGTFLAFSLFQMLNGNSRFDLDAVGGVLLLGPVLLLLPVVIASTGGNLDSLQIDTATDQPNPAHR